VSEEFLVCAAAGMVDWLLFWISGGDRPKAGYAESEGVYRVKYTVESAKSVGQAAEDLQAAVVRHGFGVLHVHNLQETLKKKGVDFPNECLIFEICNPQKANEVLSADMDLNMALPCRVSVYSEGGQTKIGMMKPGAMLAALSDSPALAEAAREVEETMMAMIAEAK
jgi:uncharacterized protein (DUF302 family)